MKKLKLGILISGRGTNMAAIARACLDPDFPAEIALVISNRPNTEGVLHAQDEGLSFEVIDHADFDNRADHEDAMNEALRDAGVELVCLAGYMRILENAFLSAWRGRLINVHPSLLPAFRGVDTHARVMERGCRIHGCTVHFVTAELDGGPIIAQEAVPVAPGDTVERLAERVLSAEHDIYPHAIRLISQKRVRWAGEEAVRDMDVAREDVARFRPTVADPSPEEAA